MKLSSPDGRLTVRCHLPGGNASPRYQVMRDGKPVTAPSSLDLTVGGKPLLAGGKLTAVSDITKQRITWQPVCGERASVVDAYHERSLTLRTAREDGLTVELRFRAYDSGVAFCYAISGKQPDAGITIDREQSEFRFLADHTCWATYSAQGSYSHVPLTKVKPNVERPLVIEAADGLHVAVAEAALVDFARMKLAPTANGPGVVSHLSSPVTAGLPLASPWRVLMVGDSPGDLLEKNDLIRNLNAPCAIADTSWIRPGKVIREVTLTTAGGKACIDFAASNGVQYVEFDAGWYGHEYDDKSDATAVALDPRRSKGPLDLQDVIRYGEQRGVGIIVYVNRRALEKQLDAILPLYRTWGIRGVKYGFVNVGSQQWTSWLHEAVRKAADHQLLVDVHDEYRPTGYSRTYPNLMTQEGIRGDECKTPANQTLAILFTRMLAGAGDNTICYYDGRVDNVWSHAYQLAKAVCFFSPLQFVYWYDRPPRAGEAVSGRVIGNEPELEFFKYVPTTWDDTRVIDGRIGAYATLARCRGADWFVGCMNGDDERTFDVPLDFLDGDVAYTATIYTDDPTIKTRTHVRIETRRVKSDTVLTFPVKAHHGVAIRLVPVKK